MKSGTRIGLAVGLGYLMGRRRKLRTALTLAAAVTAGRLSREVRADRLGDLARTSAPVNQLGAVGAPLLAAGRAAGIAAAGSGIDAISDRLRAKADALRSASDGDTASGSRAAAAESQAGDGSREEFDDTSSEDADGPSSEETPDSVDDDRQGR